MKPDGPTTLELAAPSAPRPAVHDRPDAPALPVPRQPRYRSLDFWRGIACLCIVVLHSAAIHDGYRQAAEGTEPDSGVSGLLLAVIRQLWLGVPVFFVISGYCIAAAADSTRRHPNSLKTYFLRRFRRIYPPFWAALLLTAVFIVALDCFLLPGLLSQSPDPMFHPWWLSGPQVIGNLSLTETWRHHVFGGDRGYLLRPAWTLCYEEQFYAVTGLLLLLGARRFFRSAAVLTVLCLATTFGARWLHVSIEGFFFDGHWLLFAAGILVYYQANYVSRRTSWCITAFLAFCALFAWVGPSLIINTGHTTDDRVRVAFAFALLISLLHPFDDWICSRAWTRPVAFCGTICYSLYLTHFPIVLALSHVLHNLGIRDDTTTLLVTVPVCVAVSLVVAWVFHRVVERRFLNSQPALARSATRAVCHEAVPVASGAVS